MAKIRHCIFCGAEYEYCPHCSDSSKNPSWKFNFDTERCHDIYDVMAGYSMGIKTIEDIKTILDKYEVTDYSIFSSNLQAKLNELIPQKEEESKNVEEEKKDEAPVSRRIKKNKYNNLERRVGTEE